MTTRKLTATVSSTPWLLTLGCTLAACNRQGMMRGNNELGMSGWGLTPLLVGIGFVLLLGFVLWLAIKRRKR